MARIKGTRKHPITRSISPPDIFSLPISVYFQNTNAGILLGDAHHHLVWVNPVFQQHTGEDPASLLGKPFHFVVLHMARNVLQPDIFLARM